MASRMAGEAPYDMMNEGSWPHEPQYTQDDFAATPHFGYGETLHMDTQLASTYFQISPGQDGAFQWQTSPLDYQQTHDSAVISPTLKRPPTSTDLLQAGSNGLERSNSKRSKHKQERLERREDELYHCIHPGCSHRFKLMCEVRKHFKAKHSPNEARPHGCPHCDKRFNWPKDVQRHIRQVHDKPNNAGTRPVPTVAEPPELTTDESFESDDNARTPDLSASPIPPIIHHAPGHAEGIMPEHQEAPPKTTRKKKFSLSSVGGLIMALQSLSLGSKDTDIEEDGKRYVLVTQDKSTWHKVHLDGVKTSENLVRKIREVQQKQDGRQTSQLLLYQHRHKKPNRRLDEDTLLSVAQKAARAHRTLEIVLSPIFSSAKPTPGDTEKSSDHA